MTSLATLLFSVAAKTRITGIDWVVIAIYFSILLCVAWWVVRRGKDSAADYFLAGRNLSWWIIGASIFASNIGSEHVVGLAGAGATGGVVFGTLLPELRLNIGGTDRVTCPYCEHPNEVMWPMGGKRIVTPAD